MIKILFLDDINKIKKLFKFNRKAKMKFELKPINQQISEQELIDDLIKVAKNLGKNSLKQRDYSKKC